MAALHKLGLSLTLLILMKGYYTIPLPGARSDVFYQNSYLSSLPNQEYIFQDKLDLKPTFRNILPNLTSKISAQLYSTTNTEKPTSTENPLEKLLDKLYGSKEWRGLLGQDGKVQTISTTSRPLVVETIPTLSFHGFYNYEVSGNRFDGSTSNFETSTKTPVVLSQNFENSGNSKFMMKITGARQHAYTKAPDLNSKKQGYQANGWGEFSKNTGAPSMFFRGQDGNNQQHLTMQPPIMSITQKPQLSIGDSLGLYTNFAKNDGGRLPQYVMNSGMNNFNPNEINNKQNLYHPNSAFRAFVTQTGSDPNNRQLPVDYDADAINERYIEHINSLYQEHTGKATETVYGTQQYGYRFSAYGDAKPQAYNADALNREMMESGRNLAQPQMSPMYISGPKTQNTTLSSNQKVPKVGKNEESISIHKNGNPPVVMSNTQMPLTTATKMPPRFGFVPGNLFPGQSYSSKGQIQNNEGQKGLPPQFLRHVPIATGKDAFNPDKINAAQNAYNPNAISWVQSRDIENVNKLGIEDVADDIVSTTMQTHTLATKIPKADTESAINVSASTGSGNSANGTNTGFDPNLVNLNQGQTDFVPGQIAPVFTGLNQNQYEHIQQSGKIQSGKDAPTINFDIGKLLGVKVTDNNTSDRYGQGTAPLFNTKSTNNLMKGIKEERNSSRNTASFAIGFLGSGFDPNAVNQLFSNILGSGGYGFSQGNTSVNRSVEYTNGFDPNAANVGFGNAGFSNNGFGMGNSDTSGSGYMTAFDPNKVNQMSIKNPFEQKTNSSANSGLTSYFLGIVSGNTRQGNQYNSAYISTFNPDSVNVAPYDPNKYNQVHLHFDPLNMLSKNPGKDNNTLLAAASAFDPNKVNYPNMQQALSPAAMISSSAGIAFNTLSSSSGPYSSVSVDNNASASSTNAKQLTGKTQSNTHPDQAGFDPVALMLKLMQSSSEFHPGNVGVGNQNHDPSNMIGRNSVGHAQSTTLSPFTQSMKTSAVSSTLSTVSTHSTPLGSLLPSTSFTLSTTPVAATTNGSRNGVIG